MKAIVLIFKILRALFVPGCAFKGIKSLVQIFALSCISLQMQAQASLSADSTWVETGNPFELRIKIPQSFGKPDSINLRIWENELPAQNILNQSSWQLDGGFLVKRLKVIFFDQDSIMLPALPLFFQNGDSLHTNPFQIIVQVTPSPDDLNDMAPIKDIHREPVEWTDYLPWILGVLGLIIVLTLLYRWLKRKPAGSLKSRNLEIPAHELAFKKLELLVQKQYIAKGAVKAHYAELTFILRAYLEKRYEIPALESTTAETLGHLKSRHFDPALAGPLQTLLEQADLAKFAKIIPPDSFHSESMDLARHIIMKTSIGNEASPQAL